MLDNYIRHDRRTCSAMAGADTLRCIDGWDGNWGNFLSLSLLVSNIFQYFFQYQQGDCTNSTSADSLSKYTQIFTNWVNRSVSNLLHIESTPHRKLLIPKPQMTDSNHRDNRVVGRLNTNNQTQNNARLFFELKLTTTTRPAQQQRALRCDTPSLTPLSCRPKKSKWQSKNAFWTHVLKEDLRTHK